MMLPCRFHREAMNSSQLQGLIVAACLIGCTVSSVILCIKVLPSPEESLSTLEQSCLRQRNGLVLGWVVLAGINLVAGHLIVYYMLGSTPTC
ncbi:hypothetical protein GO285_01250 [Ralstonia solanacearum]|nr:hypothetical protein [Ralstonia solanacearum]NKF94162.1 hypothetical protein [Ralstonia solanacearum]NKG09527.1 hypothetical protein [Ralstonia solanacearum]